MRVLLKTTRFAVARRSEWRTAWQETTSLAGSCIRYFRQTQEFFLNGCSPNDLGKQIVEYVENNFDNVGADFAEEALKMHYGVAEPRNIRGVSTPKEEETLKDQGINFFKFPVPVKPSDSEA